jgi:hypothetical protein
MGTLDNIQDALGQADVLMDKLTDMKFVEVTDGAITNDYNTTNDMSPGDMSKLNSEALKSGNGTGFYVQDGGGTWHCVSNMGGGQWFQRSMQFINDGAQKAATGVTTQKAATEAVKRAYA